MSQQLTLELSDEVYADLQQKASAVGLSISEWIVAILRAYPENTRSLRPTIKQAAIWTNPK